MAPSWGTFVSFTKGILAKPEEIHSINGFFWLWRPRLSAKIYLSTRQCQMTNAIGSMGLVWYIKRQASVGGVKIPVPWILWNMMYIHLVDLVYIANWVICLLPSHSIESRTGRVRWRLWTPKFARLPTTNPMASPVRILRNFEVHISL